MKRDMQTIGFRSRVSKALLRKRDFLLLEELPVIRCGRLLIELPSTEPAIAGPMVWLFPFRSDLFLCEDAP